MAQLAEGRVKSRIFADGNRLRSRFKAGIAQIKSPSLELLSTKILVTLECSRVRHIHWIIPGRIILSIQSFTELIPMVYVLAGWGEYLHLLASTRPYRKESPCHENRVTIARIRNFVGLTELQVSIECYRFRIIALYS
jgi:hypothetical protein